MTSHKLDKHVEDILQHAGVKGMKWGVRNVSKSAAKAYKKYDKKRSAKEKIVLDKYHDRNKNKTRYKNLYSNSLKKTNGNHLKAVKRVKEYESDMNRMMFKMAIPLVAPTAIRAGRTLVKTYHNVSSNPEMVRAGKNLMKAAVGSPLRYVDGSAMKNVIN